MKARIEFCKRHKDWSVDEYKSVIWSDVTKVKSFQSDGIEYFWKRPHELIQMNHVKQTMEHGVGSIMVRGCFTWLHVGPLLKINGLMKMKK